MKALVLRKPGCLEMEDVPAPSPKEGELLVRTKAATICTSDINDIKHNLFGIECPMIMGHEGAGIVQGLGSGVTGFAVGDKIAAHPVIPCGSCASCKRGLAHLCDDMVHFGINLGGVFAEYFVIRADRARKIATNIDFATASLMEPVCVCIQALDRAGIQDNSNVLIIGDGPFGLIMTCLLKNSKVGRLLLVGRYPFRLAFADQAVSINDKETEDVLADILKHTDGEGIDSAILCAGNAQAVNTAIAALRSRGTLSLFSAVTPAAAIDLFKIHVKELSICGSCNDSNRLDEAMEVLADENLGLDKIITHRLPFAEWREAFRLAQFGKSEAIKVSLCF